MTTSTSVTTSSTGRSFQIGRPSSISYTRFMPRLNAATYPEADQSATTRPTTSASPAEGASVSRVEDRLQRLDRGLGTDVLDDAEHPVDRPLRIGDEPEDRR